MKTNYHTHTEHCRHAAGLPADYARQALECGISILGMSDHAPFKDVDYGYRMPFSELDMYIDEVQAAKEDFAGSVKILSSLEIEYLPKYTRGKNYYEKLLTEKKMDYLLLGEHFFTDRHGDLHNITSIETPALAVEYAEACSTAMKTGYFKIIAHPDLFCINSFSWNDDYERASDILIESSERTGVVLELNANGIRRGLRKFPDGERYQYPHMRFWEKVKQAGLPAIVGSDAHNMKDLWDEAMKKSIQMLDSLGIRGIGEIK